MINPQDMIDFIAFSVGTTGIIAQQIHHRIKRNHNSFRTFRDLVIKNAATQIKNDEALMRANKIMLDRLKEINENIKNLRGEKLQ